MISPRVKKQNRKLTPLILSCILAVSYHNVLNYVTRLRRPCRDAVACCKVKHCHHACTVCLLQPLLHGEEIRDIVPDCQVRPVYDTDHRRLDAQQDTVRTQQVHRRANPRPAHSLDGAAFEQPGLRLPNVRYLRFLHVAIIRYTSVCWFCAENFDYFFIYYVFFQFLRDTLLLFCICIIHTKI